MKIDSTGEQIAKDRNRDLSGKLSTGYAHSKSLIFQRFESIINKNVWITPKLSTTVQRVEILDCRSRCGESVDRTDERYV